MLESFSAMGTNFAGVVEEVKHLSAEEKIELRDLIDGYLIEERRDSILAEGEASRLRLANDELEFSSDIDELMASLNG